MKILVIICFLLFTLNGVAFCNGGLPVKMSINSNWRFILEDVQGADSPEYNDESWERINIPHTYNAQDIVDDVPGYYMGKTWYRKRFNVDKAFTGNRLLLYFGAVNRKADVYVNGKFIGDHLGGYTAFSFDITSFVKFGEENFLSVKVDNSDSLSWLCPPVSADFSIFGGIYRDVYLVYSNPVHFENKLFASKGVFWETPSISEKEAIVKIKGRVENEGSSEMQVMIQSNLYDQNQKLIAKLSSKIRIPSGTVQSFEQLSKTINSPALWTPENPVLYSVETVLTNETTGEILDQCTNSLGFRWFSTNSNQFFLNGKPYLLRGACRHQDFKNIGIALPNEVNRSDMKLLKEMGGNFVRIGHYPQDPEVYKACDELGLIVWSEIPVVDAVRDGESFSSNAKTMMKEMIYQNFNHPSVAIWAYMNEVHVYTPAALKLAAQLDSLTRKTDPHRLTAIAYHARLNDTPFTQKEQRTVFSIPDMNGFNVYLGWYSDNTNDLNWFPDSLKKLSPDRPILYSEYGAGSDIRLHAYEPTIADYTTEYQTIYHQEHIKHSMPREFIAGYAIWNLVDFQVEPRMEVFGHINNKGLVTSDRKPKDVYYWYQSIWGTKPMVHIASHDWVHRTEVVDSISIPRPFILFSNMPKVELRQNGNSLGFKSPSEGQISWNVTFSQGINHFEAIGTSSTETVSDVVDIDFSPRLKNLSRAIFKDLYINVGQSKRYFYDELTGQTWIPDQPYTKGSWGYLDGTNYNLWKNVAAWNGVREGVFNIVNGTTAKPVFETFKVGITGYKFDVPDGEYRLRLCFAEPFSENDRKDPSMNTGADKNGERVFQIAINNQTIASEFNILNVAGGAFKAYSQEIAVSARNSEGITLKLTPLKGLPLLSGIVLKK